MTTLRPAFEIALTHAGNSVVLRASLRAAVAINDQCGGLPAVLQRLARQSFTTTRAVIRAAATDRHQAERLLSSLDGHPLRSFMDEAQAACLELIAALLPAPDDDQAKKTSTRTRTQEARKPLGDYFGDLFRFATGWLGWTPDTAWNASLAEIEAAFTAHIDRLIAMNGGKPDDQDEPETPANIYTAARMAEIEELGFDPVFDRNALHALKAKL